MTFSGYHLERMGCTTSLFSCTSSNLTLFKLQVLQAELWEKGQSAQTKLQTARDAQAKLQNATCETTHVHKTLCGKHVVHKHVVHKAFLDPKARGHNVIESANTVVCESAKAFPRGV